MISPMRTIIVRFDTPSFGWEIEACQAAANFAQIVADIETRARREGFDPTHYADGAIADFPDIVRSGDTDMQRDAEQAIISWVCSCVPMRAVACAIIFGRTISR